MENNHLIRPDVEGKFIRVENKKFYIRGITYGTFKPDAEGNQFPSSEIIERDFQMMAGIGINTVRTYTVPSLRVMDLALKYSLRLMIGLPWIQHLTFLENMRESQRIIYQIRETVKGCHAHPAILCYTIGNEIPAIIVRWYGEQKIERFLKQIYQAVKSEDPEVLVTYVNYPTTEYLNLPFLDFFCFNVYLETREKLSAYLAKLHNLIGEKPLVLAEIGLDSYRNGVDRQASVLDWQVRTVFEKGCAGACVFTWTDEWWRGGDSILDWDFGVVDRERNPKPAYETLRRIYSQVPYASEHFPRMSVVICSYNGAHTIGDTLEGCMKLEYPDYEVIVVNDGSTDSTRSIAEQYPVKLINTENRGLSNARNTGLLEASGEIVAYIDDDAWPDPQWLTYLASAYLNSDHAGIGGPNIAPKSKGRLASSVAFSPGRPLHVLTTDEIAEHIPGCNMSFRRKTLIEIGGFDPVFRSAGDDVDLCWRIYQNGYTIGYHPAAFVWHHCRNSFSMYWKQQIGYGKAEALLERKWPERYNRLGHLSWVGYIYGNGLTRPLTRNGKKIYYGRQGTALFQSVYQPVAGFFQVLPLMPEWYLFIFLLGLISLLGFEWKPMLWAFPAFMASALILLFQAGNSARNAYYSANTPVAGGKLKFWILTTSLHIVQPYARLVGRITNGLTLWKHKLDYISNVKVLFTYRRIRQHWSVNWKPTEEWLGIIRKELILKNNKVIQGGEYDRWDYRNMVGLFGSIRSLLTIEEHGMGKQMLKLRMWMEVPKTGLSLLLAFSALSAIAFINEAYVSFGFFCMLSLIILLKILSDQAGSLISLIEVFDHLPSGIDGDNPVEFPTADHQEKQREIKNQSVRENRIIPVKTLEDVYQRNLFM